MSLRKGQVGKWDSALKIRCLIWGFSPMTSMSKLCQKLPTQVSEFLQQFLANVFKHPAQC